MKENKIPVETLTEFPRPRTPNYRPVLLVVSAHPDDETFTVGGTLALHAANGWRVKLVCVTHGEQSVAQSEDLDTVSYQKLRLAELHKAVKILGIEKLILRNWGDRKVASQRSLKAAADLLTIMIQTNPDVVITFGPDGLSGHPDHVAVSRFTTAAFNQYRMPKVCETDEPRLYYVEHLATIPSSCLGENKSNEAAPVTTKITISSVWSDKIVAMKAYRTQKHLLTEVQQNKDALITHEECFHLVSPADAKEH